MGAPLKNRPDAACMWVCHMADLLVALQSKDGVRGKTIAELAETIGMHPEAVRRRVATLYARRLAYIIFWRGRGSSMTAEWAYGYRMDDALKPAALTSTQRARLRRQRLAAKAEQMSTINLTARRNADWLGAEHGRSN